MVFKINLGHKGKTWKLELDSESLIGKKIGEKLQGQELKPELAGFELEITGTSDKAGFPGKKGLEGANLKKVLLIKGFGLKSRPRREGKRKKRKMPLGFRLRKTLRGNTISKDTNQINIKVLKITKPLEEIFPEQNKPKEQAPKAATTEGAVENKQ
ncbi:MAG: 30S ribosomal protein S6e [Candidatus Pacearchaeota archaeon]|nr:30S ribosomal protein S6e [Candidatus Pacearchaeota archaeon]